MAECRERAVVFGVKVGAGSGLEEPGGSVVIFLVAGEAGQAGGVEPVEIAGEPFLDGCEIGFREGFGSAQEGDGLGYFGEVDCFYYAFRGAGLYGWNCLRVRHAGDHAGCGVDEPGSQVADGLLGVAVFFGEDEGCG